MRVVANTWRIYDIDDATVAIGYAPRDDAEAFRPPRAGVRADLGLTAT